MGSGGHRAPPDRALSGTVRNERHQGVTRTDRALALGAFALGIGAMLLARHRLGLWGAAGTDAAIWGLTALDLSAGAPAHAPPLYPALVLAGHALGLPLVSAGWGVALLAAAATPAAVLWTSRAAGATRSAAILAALAALSQYSHE